MKHRFLKGIIDSFSASWRGILHAFKYERTFRIMTASMLIVFVLMSTLPLTKSESLVLLLVTGLVLVLELINTMVEKLVDLLKPRLSSYVRDVKDLMAAAVLVASFFALLIGILIFIPHLGALLAQV